MVNALTHSRPPSYRSHISDHAVIESVANENPIRAYSGSSSGSRNAALSSQVQVAQVHPVPENSRNSGKIHPVPEDSRNSGNSTQYQRRAGDLVSSSQDVSIVSVSTKTDLKSTPDSGSGFHYHMKIGENSPEICDSSPIYERIFEKRENEKRSVVTIVQASTACPDPVIVTVSGSLEHRLNTSASESGSDFSTDIRASPAEVEILATL